MTTFESILLLAVTACVIITAFGVVVIKRMLKEIIDRKYANWEQLRKIETHTNFLPDISRQLDNIKDDILDDRRDIVAMLASINDIVDKMHRNICADVAEKMVDRAFPIKEGEPLDKPFDKPFVSPGVTNWPPCYWGGPCTNPHRDCVGCPGYNVSGGWTSTSNKYDTQCRVLPTATVFIDAYKQGYIKCVAQMQDEFNELLKACHTSLRNQTKVDNNEITNQMKGGQDGQD